MLVEPLGIEKRRAESVLRARITPTAHGTRSSFELEYAFDGLSPSALSRSGDVFVPALLLPAMALGEDLEIEAPLSPRLLRGAATAMDIYRAWGRGLERIRVLGDGDARSRRGERVALYFTAGVDSFYSLLKSERSGDLPNARVSHLLFIHGFDIDLSDVARQTTVNVHIDGVARETRKQALFARSNLRRFAEGLVPWRLHHGGALASVGLALDHSFKRLVIPSSWAYQNLRPWGSHPLLDPLWSTETVEFVHDGCEARRAEKVRDEISRSPLALANLRVCWEHLNADYNCGRCEKCVATMAMLHSQGVLEASSTFPRTFEPELVRRLRFDDPATSSRLQGLLDGMRADGAEADLADAIRHALRAERRRKFLQSARNRCGVMFKRLRRRFRIPPCSPTRRARRSTTS